MARYINAEKLEKDGWSASRTYPQDAHTMVYETKKMTDFPTADVVEVVRCNDCKFYNEDEMMCNDTNGFDRYWKPTDFCSYGKRREE